VSFSGWEGGRFKTTLTWASYACATCQTRTLKWGRRKGPPRLDDSNQFVPSKLRRVRARKGLGCLRYLRFANNKHCRRNSLAAPPLPPPPAPPPGSFAPAPRDEILSRAFSGKITPEQAEAEAARLGLLPFAHTPHPEEFDPMGEPWWTLGMAAAGIIWRTPTAVRRVWPEYRQKVIEWRGPVWYRHDESGYGYKVVVEEAEFGDSSFGKATVKEYHLVRQSPFNLFDVLAAAALGSPEDGKVFVEGPDARTDLWRLLQSGTLLAEGIPADSSKRRPIRDAEWVDLDYFDQPGWLSDSIGVILENRERYRSVRVRSEDVTRLWIDPRLRDIISPPRPKLPPTVSPTGGGFMPLYCAAQWVASKGGNEEFDPLDLPRWKTAYSELLARLASDDIRVIGKANGMREPVAGFNFAACPIDYPFQEANFDLVLWERALSEILSVPWRRRMVSRNG
jgi:hypothetical protein